VSTFGYSYLRIDPRHVVSTAWSLLEDGVERDLPVQFETWEHSLDLHLLRRFRLDFDGVAADLALDPATLVLTLLVTVGTGGSGGDRRRNIFYRGNFDTGTRELSPEFVVPGVDVSQAISLRTAILLGSPAGAGSPLSPKLAGQRLWDDWRLSIQEPVGPRFRIDPASFSTQFPDTPDALWRLEWSPEDPSRDFTGSVRLLINSDNHAFVTAVSRNDDLVTRLMMTGVICQITRATLANPIFTGEADEPTSVGAAVSSWIERAFPGQSLETVSGIMTQDPAFFEAALAGLADA
jgi:hypothetical protein